MDYFQDDLTMLFPLFNRKQENCIDWVGTTLTGPWQAENIGETSISGAEFRATGTWRSLSASFKHTYMNSDEKGGYISKYALRFPEHQSSLSVRNIFGANMYVSVQMVYKKRTDQDDYFLVSGMFAKQYKEYEFFIKGTNLFDREYEDIPGIPQPGRWLGIGCAWKQ